jgi:hypothetical protein
MDDSHRTEIEKFGGDGWFLRCNDYASSFVALFAYGFEDVVGEVVRSGTLGNVLIKN